MGNHRAGDVSLELKSFLLTESCDSLKIWDLRILLILQVKEKSYMIYPIYRDHIGYNKVEDSSSRIPCIIIRDDSLAMICKYFWFSISSGLLVKCEVSNAANEKLLEGREGYCKTWTSHNKQSLTYKLKQTFNLSIRILAFFIQSV